MWRQDPLGNRDRGDVEWRQHRNPRGRRFCDRGPHRHRGPGAVTECRRVGVRAMSRRIVAVLALATLGSMVPAFAEGVTVASATLDTYGTCVLSGVAATSTAVADIMVDQKKPNANSDSASPMDVQSRTSQNRRVYVRFDLTLCSPAIPVTATIVDARLDLFVIARAAVCRTIDVFLLTATWAENTITWNNQSVGTSINNPPTAGAAPSPRSAPPRVPTRPTKPTERTLTADAQSFVNGTAVNYGWLLRDDNENGGTTYLTSFSTSEENSAAGTPPRDHLPAMTTKIASTNWFDIAADSVEVKTAPEPRIVELDEATTGTTEPLRIPDITSEPAALDTTGDGTDTKTRRTPVGGERCLSSSPRRSSPDGS